MNWEIIYDNDTGPNDEGFSCWWTVTDGNKSFRCYAEDHAKWLCNILNARPSNAEITGG